MFSNILKQLWEGSMTHSDDYMIETLLNTIDRYDSTLIIALPRWAQNG